MSEELDLLEETVNRLFADMFAGTTPDEDEPPFDEALWEAIDSLGLSGLLVGEEQGGGGASFVEGRIIARAAGRYAARIPLVETILASRWLAASREEIPAGPLSIATRIEGSIGGSDAEPVFEGRLLGVPWGSQAKAVVFVVESAGSSRLVTIRPEFASEIVGRLNMAGEPRDTLSFENAPVVARSAESGLQERIFDELALMRTGQIEGAIGAALDRTIRHAGEREQFGRPIGKFQAVQQLLARTGAELAAVDCAARAAFHAAARGRARFEIASARLRANLASEQCVGAAHQVHGAIGFTRELDLRLFTTRLLSWRSEFGNDAFWADRLGGEVAARGAEAFWPDLTARADAVALGASGSN
jgi:acyl-CoA dehydrogenase